MSPYRRGSQCQNNLARGAAESGEICSRSRNVGPRQTIQRFERLLLSSVLAAHKQMEN